MRIPRSLLWISCWAWAWLSLSALHAAPANRDVLPQTLAERTAWRDTGRYLEVAQLCADWARAMPRVLRCERFGTTPQGRPMWSLVANTLGVLSPDAARARGLPVVLVQGGIHAGEIDGKDAGFLALQALLHGLAAPGALDHAVLVFVPVFNVDGHERFGAWNRPNQRGPREMGWRTTAQNFNLNRDYAKADAPEMQAMLKLVQRWDPLATVDLHVTDGAKFQHDVAVMVEPVQSADLPLREAGRALRDKVIEEVNRQGSMALPFYPSFVVEDDPASGVRDGVSPPRFSTGYFPLRNRLGMLVETHSWKDYPTRVKVTRNVVVSVLAQVAVHGRQWLAEAHAADARALALGGQMVALDYAASERARIIEFQGYAYTRTPSEVSGAWMTRYDESRPEVWRLPLHDEVLPRTEVQAPRAGYLVPPAQASQVRTWLDRHGLRYQWVQQAQEAVAVQVFKAERARWDAKSVEGHQRLTVAGVWQAEQADLAAGSLFVPIAQPLARLAIALLEPQAPDSMLAWGEFNNFFERKEYMEPYVAEEVAREQLAADPALAKAFAERLARDAEFAASPEARLEFFYRRHASWDTQYQRYPVLRLDVAPQALRRLKTRPR